MAEPGLPANDLFAANGWLSTERLEPAAAKALERAACWAADTRWDSVRTPHVFMGLLSAGDGRVGEWCRMLGTTPDSLLLQFASMFTCRPGSKTPVVRAHREFISENALRVLRSALSRARACGRDLVTVPDLLVALFSPGDGIVAGCFVGAGIGPERLAALAVAADERNRR